MRRATPFRTASASNPSRTSRARCEAGNVLSDSGSSTSGMPTSFSKNARCSASGHERTMRRNVFTDESVTNRVSSSCIGSTLQRPPPLTRILRPPSLVRSSRTVSAPPAAAKIAAMVPAAPAPMTTSRRRGVVMAGVGTAVCSRCGMNGRSGRAATMATGAGHGCGFHKRRAPSAYRFGPGFQYGNSACSATAPRSAIRSSMKPRASAIA